MARQWSINGRFATQPLTGVQRYAHEVVSALDRWVAEGHPLVRDLRLELLVPQSAGDLPRLQAIPVRAVGHEHVLAWTPQHSAATRKAAGRDTIVILGSPAPHKNVELVLGLAERLAAAGLRIAVVGQRDARVFKNAGAGPPADNVLWLGRLPDDELAALLRDSLCLAFPSLAEGFGIPPLEAMTLRCPVVASDCASLPEVCGDAALLVSPNDPEAWYASFVRLHRDVRLRTDLINRGETRVRRFSWRASAERYLEAMAQADGITIGPRVTMPRKTAAG